MSSFESLNRWFSHVRIKNDLALVALPGHFVELNQERFYISNANENSLEIIVPQHKLQAVVSTLEISVLELQGQSINPPNKNHFYLWRVHNQGLSACLFYFRRYRKDFNGLVFIGTDSQFPFTPAPSRTLIPHCPSDTIAALPLFEDWQIPNRLASATALPGCYPGSVMKLAESWLARTPIHVDFFINIA